MKKERRKMVKGRKKERRKRGRKGKKKGASGVGGGGWRGGMHLETPVRMTTLTS